LQANKKYFADDSGYRRGTEPFGSYTILIRKFVRDKDLFFLGLDFDRDFRKNLLRNDIFKCQMS